MNTDTLITVVPLAISVLNFLGIGVAIKFFWEDRHNKKLAQTESAKKLRKLQVLDEIREVFLQEIAPLQLSINKLSVQIQHNTDTDVTLLRCRMKSELDRCKEQGYSSDSDKANWLELYNAYKDNGGNHFKEYVDVWKSSMMSLPNIPNLNNNESDGNKSDTSDSL